MSDESPGGVGVGRHLNDLPGFARRARSAASTLCRVLKVSIVRGIIEEAS